MDWHHPSPLEPNLKFASELKGDLKTKYFEQHEKAKQALENFSCSLQNVLLEHQKLLNENIELIVTNDKLRKIIDDQESNQQIAAIIEPPSSEILGASPNCKLQNLSKLSSSEKKNNFADKSPSIVQKENVNDFPPIYSEDFNSDIDDGSFITHRSPPVSVASSPVKIQSSPILSKRKKHSSKKSNSSINTSSQSVDSNNDSKISSANTSSFEKNIDIDYDLSKEFEKDYENEPLKPIENILLSSFQKNHDKSVPCKILNVSKTNYAKTEFLDKGKKSRQTVLSFKKVAPVMDISKVDLDESLGNTSMNLLKKGNSWSETFYDNSKANQSSDSILMNMKKLNSPRNGLNGSKISNNQSSSTKDKTFCDNSMKNENSDSTLGNTKKCNSPRNGSKECKTLKNQNSFTKEDDTVETSPMHNEKPSKLRNKCSFIKKSDISNDKEKSSQLSKGKLSLSKSNNNIVQQKRSFNNGAPDIKYKSNISLEANVSQRSVSDETYFSQAELTNYKNDVTNFDVDLTEFEDGEMQCDTPPAKKMLLNSFDVIPGRVEESLGYAYKEGPVRKKSEREKLEGWSCKDCDNYYGNLNLPEEERKKRQNFCSRHRAKHNPQPDTPPSFWNPVFSESEGDSSIFND